MDYEVISAIVEGAPVTLEDEVTREWQYNVTSNIVVNTYPEFYHADTDKFQFPINYLKNYLSLTFR